MIRWRVARVVAAGLCAFGLLPLAAQQSSPASSPPALTLSRCLEIALKSNPDLLRASTRFVDAEGEAIQLRSILYPRVVSEALLVPPTIYLQVDEYIYNRATGPQLELSRLTRAEAEWNYQQVVTDVVFHVRQAFALALARQRLAEVSQDYLDQYRALLKSSNPLFDAGRIQKGELLHLQVQVNLAEQQLVGAQSDRHQALLQLELLLGHHLDDATVLEGTLGQERFPELDIRKLADQALRDRPDLQMLQAQEQAQGQMIVLASQPLYPTVGFSSDSTVALPFQTQLSGYDINRNFDEAASQRVAGNSQLPLSLYLNWTFFDGGSTRGQEQSGKAKLASQDEALAALRQAVPGQIEQAVETLQNAESSLKTMANTPTAEQVRTQMNLDFDAGRIHLIDKTLVEDTIFNLEKSRLDADLQVSLTAAALDYTLGHVVQFAPRKSP